MEAWERRRPNTRATVPCRPHSAQRPCPTETLRTPLRLNLLCATLPSLAPNSTTINSLMWVLPTGSGTFSHNVSWLVL